MTIIPMADLITMIQGEIRLVFPRHPHPPRNDSVGLG